MFDTAIAKQHCKGKTTKNDRTEPNSLSQHDKTSFSVIISVVYGSSKLSIKQLSRNVNIRNQLPGVCLHPGNVNITLRSTTTRYEIQQIISS